MNILSKNVIEKITNRKKSSNSKRGAELVETMLMIGISITLIVVLFYPQIMTLMNFGLVTVQTWFSNALSMIGQTV